MSGCVKLLIISDLHYKKHSNEQLRPAAATSGAPGYDPVEKFVELISSNSLKADYVICPGDITDRASKDGFKSGWDKLNAIKFAVGAKHLIAATGNHEVDSRATDPVHDKPGNSEAHLDPVGFLQGIPDYPSSVWNGDDRSWVYWGRGYEFIEDGEILFLLVNSSHFHPTTKANEFERGRIGDNSIKLLLADIEEKLSSSKALYYIAILHHPPINHESMSHDLGRIEMFNGARLIEILTDSGQPWLVIHGHKHDGRMVMAQGAGYQPIVFAAGSIGADLNGHAAGLYTRLQGYVVELEKPELLPTLKGKVKAYSWVDNRWISATMKIHGIPDGSGFASPAADIHLIASSLMSSFKSRGEEFLKWDEARELVPELNFLMPGQLKVFRKAVEKLGGIFTWDENNYLPDDLAFRSPT